MLCSLVPGHILDHVLAPGGHLTDWLFQLAQFRAGQSVQGGFQTNRDLSDWLLPLKICKKKSPSAVHKYEHYLEYRMRVGGCDKGPLQISRQTSQNYPNLACSSTPFLIASDLSSMSISPNSNLHRMYPADYHIIKDSLSKRIVWTLGK